MKYLSFIIVPMFVGIFTPLIINYIKASIIRKEAHFKPDYFQISSSPGLTISLMLLSVVSFVVWLLILPSNTSNVALNVLVPITIFIFVIFAYITIRTKIIVKGDDVVVTPFFGKKRFNEFKDGKPNLSNKVLSNCLKEMEENGLISRNSNENNQNQLLTV